MMDSTQPRRFGSLDVRVVGGQRGDGGGDGPLVVLLHGFGAPATDLVALARYLDVSPQVRFAFPAAPLDLSPYGFGDGRAWWMLDLEEMQRAIQQGYRPDRTRTIPDGLLDSRHRLAETLDALESTYTVPSGKLILGGFSQGAMVACDTAVTSDRALGGLILFSGTLLAEDVWTAGMKRRPGLRVVQSHGTSDPLLPFDAALRLHDLWAEAGAAIDMIRFDGGHTIPPGAITAAAKLIRATTGEST